MSDELPITVTITRTVLPGREGAFEHHVRAFIPVSLSFPGHMGVHVLKPGPGGDREYRVVIRFATARQWREFLASTEYARFRAAIDPLLEDKPRVEELTGLESWFTLPGNPLRPLPRWKMAIVTLAGVYPVSLGINLLLGPVLADLPIWLRVLVVAGLMVGVLTWVVMPQLTRLFGGWLHAEPMRDQRADLSAAVRGTADRMVEDPLDRAG